MYKIVFTGGGTGGHIFPLLAVVRELKKSLPESQLFYLGPQDEYALGLLKAEGVFIKTISSGKLRRYFSLKNFIDIFKVPIGFCQALAWFFVKAPDLVFSKGGYGSLPVVLAAAFLQVPIFLHESDIVPGLSSRITAKAAAEIFTSFPETEHFIKGKFVCLGNPIRTAVLGGSKEKAKEIFRLRGDKPLIFIVGGSQGAQQINNLILEILPEMLSNFELIHQTGKDNYKNIKAEADALLSDDLKTYYHIIPFLNEAEIKHVLTSADIVISRAGSSALFEIMANAKPSILIPLVSSAQDHQIKNAYYFVRQKASEALLQENLKPHFFLERLKYFISRPDILKQMSDNAQRLARPKAAKVIADYLAEYLKQT